MESENDPFLPKQRNPCRPSVKCCLNVSWWILLALYALWIVYIFRLNQDSLFHPAPGTTVTMDEVGEKLNFPAMSVCNLKPGAPLSVIRCSGPDGQFCNHLAKNFTFNGRACFTLNSCLEKTGTNQTAFAPKMNGTAAATCNPLHATISEDEDIASEVRVVLSIHDSDPNGQRDADSVGVTVTLSDNDAKPDLGGKAFNVAPGYATLVRMKKIVEIPLHKPPETMFEATTSMAGLRLNPKTYGKKEDLVYLAFSYKLLAQMTITEVPPYNWATFFSEVGGLAGLLLGLGGFNILEYWMRTFHRAFKRALNPEYEI